jgi:hypothetical protein
VDPEKLVNRWVQQEADALQRKFGWTDPERLEVRIEDRIGEEMATMSHAHRSMMRAWLAAEPRTRGR